MFIPHRISGKSPEGIDAMLEELGLDPNLVFDAMSTAWRDRIETKPNINAPEAYIVGFVDALVNIPNIVRSDAQE